MTRAHVQLATDGTGKNMDTNTVTSTEAGTPAVHRQVISLGDPLTEAAFAAIKNSAIASADYAVAVGLHPSSPLPAGTNTIGAVKQATQASLTATLCSALTGTGAQAGQSLDGYDGAGTLQITAVGTVGAQAVTLQIEGSIDNSNWGIIGTAQIDATANPSYTAASFTLTPGASTISHLYAVRDTVKFIRVNVTANSLGTGLTATLYTNPV